jgi:serine protease SohB
MAEFLFQYGLFLAKALTVVVAIGAVLLLSFGMSRRGQAGGGLVVEKLNDRYREMAATLRRAALPRAQWRAHEKQQKRAAKAATKGADRHRVFVLDFKGDIRATAVASLREEVTAVLAVAGPGDEVLLRLENFGGAVHEHGLAASQLQRLRDRAVPLTVAVDKGAASGGYLMASVANRILAAPFAVLGSIGVIAQIPNFHRLLDARGVDVEQITAGRYKRTVTMFGQNTDEDRAKLRAELEEVHELFKKAVTANRPQLDMQAVATGEHWYGTRAMELGLVDELVATDDYLLRMLESADLLHVTWRTRPTLQQRVLAAMRAAADEVTLWVAGREQENRFH